MVDTESQIFDNRPMYGECGDGFCDVMLLKTTAYALLYRARRAGKQFLVKTTKDNDEQQLRMLRREYELSISCDHHHIVHVYTFEESAFSRPAIVMEYIEGRTLDDYLGENPPMSERCRVLGELLAAVGYLHRRGVIHNDIKPENILITRADDTLKLIDFGLADSDAHYALRALGSTPRYASPELLLQDSQIDARSDIYSIGILMEQIVGRRYRSISKRCRRHNRDGRYENIAALERAIKHRYRPLKVLLAVAVLALVALPSLLLAHYKLSEQRAVDERELLCDTIERDVERIYQSVADSISRAVYYEFANNHLRSFFEELAAYQSENIATIEDNELGTLALNVYVRTLNKCHAALSEQTALLPYLSDEKMSPDKRLFYNALLESRQPYRPYGEE